MRGKILLFLLLFLVFPRSAYSFSPFVRSSSNPLPFSSTFPNWNEIGRFQPSVLFDQGVYKMWYASYTGVQFKIVYATSTDGISWTRQNLLDVYPGFDNHDPAILKTQTGYTLFFTASTNGGSRNFKIYRIDSTDGINFDQSSHQLVLQPSGLLESSAVSSASVIYKNGVYYLFYLCWGNQGFRICMATSSDGSSWQRCQNNPVIPEPGDGPNIFEKGGIFYLFFQSPLGFRQAESTNDLSCSMTWTNFQTILTGGPPGSYDSQSMISPQIIEKNSKLFLYYSGLGPLGWTVNLAAFNLPEEEKSPIVFLPGLFGSWNKEAILHNQDVGFRDWKLSPIVKEYEGIKKTFLNLGYELNKDFFFFPYDWRKNVAEITNNLNTFINEDVIPQNPQNTDISIVGHSLGGLVGRIYGQKHGVQNLSNILTIGSPHQGTAHAYKAVEAGEFDRADSFQWLVQKIILQLHRNGLDSDKKIINSHLPVLQDLFPTYNFLVEQGGSQIDIQNMYVQNVLLQNYNASIGTIFPELLTIAGEKGDTLFGFKIGERSKLDVLLELYPDGRPVQSNYNTGDGVILSASAAQDSDFKTLNLDHGEIVYEKEGVKEILNQLKISYLDSQIEVGARTTVFPSLIFLLLSPATMEVEFNNQLYSETDGMIFIDNAQDGTYILTVIGKDFGQYKILIGIIGNTKDNWLSIDGEIIKTPPESQKDIYSITFNQNNPHYFPVNQDNIESLFDLLSLKLKLIKRQYNHSDLGEAQEEAEDAKNNFIRKKYDKMRKQLLECLEEIFNVRKRAPNLFRNMLYDSLSQLENLYERTSQVSNYSPKSPKVRKKADSVLKKYISLESFLFQQKNKNKDVEKKVHSLSKMKEKIDRIDEAISENRLSLSEILLLSADKLGEEAKRF